MSDKAFDISVLISESKSFENGLDSGYKQVFVPIGYSLFPVSSIKMLTDSLVVFYGINSDNRPFEIIQNINNLNVLIVNQELIPVKEANPIGFERF